jgi:hypothetical protein
VLKAILVRLPGLGPVDNHHTNFADAAQVVQTASKDVSGNPAVIKTRVNGAAG